MSSTCLWSCTASSHTQSIIFVSKIVLHRWEYKTNSHQTREEVCLRWKSPTNGPTWDMRVGKHSSSWQVYAFQGCPRWRGLVGPSLRKLYAPSSARLLGFLRLYPRPDLLSYCRVHKLSCSMQSVSEGLEFWTGGLALWLKVLADLQQSLAFLLEMDRRRQNFGRHDRMPLTRALATDWRSG